MQFSSLVERIGGPSARAWEIHFAALEGQRNGKDVIILSVGDPSFDTPKIATQRAIKALHAGDTHYTEITGKPAFRKAVAANHSRHSGQAVTAENVIILAGTQNGLFAAAMCLVGAGDEVIVPEPMYLTYRAAIQATGAILVPVPSPAHNGFRLDLHALEAAITSKTRAIFFATPNNPTGVVCTKEELEGIATLARKHNLWVVADEVYGRLCFETSHTSIGASPGMSERTVTLSSLSKSHAMTGWRTGWMVAPVELIEHVQNLALCMLYGLPGFCQEAAIEALLHCDAEVETMREAYRRRRDHIMILLDAVPELRCIKPQAGMFMLVDVRKTGLSAVDFSTQLFTQTGVAVLDATPFGPSLAGHIRLSFGIDDTPLQEACRRISAFVADCR